VPEVVGRRVLVATHYFATNGYGIESVTAKINELLRARGFAVRWISSIAHNRVTRSFPSNPDEIGIASWDGIRQATDLAWPVFGPWALPRIVREVYRSEVVHLHEGFYPLNQAVLWSARLLGRPIVVTQHIADMPIAGAFRGNAVRLANLVMTRPAFAVADRVVYDSRRTQAHFAKFSEGKDAFVPNGCDTGLFRPVTRDQALVIRRDLGLPTEGKLSLFVGRFIEKKGLHGLRSLAAAHPALNFVFVGEGPLDPRSWELPNVIVRAPVPLAELRAFYQASDIFVLPSVGEGLPLVVQEVCCCGVAPIVSTEILDACPDIAPFAYDAGEGGRSLQPMFEMLLRKPETQDRVLQRASFARRLWSWERCGDAYAEILESVVGCKTVSKSATERSTS